MVPLRQRPALLQIADGLVPRALRQAQPRQLDERIEAPKGLPRLAAQRDRSLAVLPGPLPLPHVVGQQATGREVYGGPGGVTETLVHLKGALIVHGRLVERPDQGAGIAGAPEAPMQ